MSDRGGEIPEAADYYGVHPRFLHVYPGCGLVRKMCPGQQVLVDTDAPYKPPHEEDRNAGLAKYQPIVTADPNSSAFDADSVFCA